MGFSGLQSLRFNNTLSIGDSMSKINIRTILTYFLSFIVFLSFGFGGSNAKAAASIPNDTWYLVCEINKQGEVNILSQKVVKMQAPLQTMS